MNYINPKKKKELELAEKCREVRRILQAKENEKKKK